MRDRFHGLMSLGLVAVAVVVAAVVMFRVSWTLGLLYLAICVAALVTILRVYCAKCPCKIHCAHVFPGEAAAAFGREPGPYTPGELVALTLALAVLLGLPLVWLWRYPVLFAIFLILNGIAFFQIRGFVCRRCENVYCPLASAEVLQERG